MQQGIKKHLPHYLINERTYQVKGPLDHSDELENFFDKGLPNAIMHGFNTSKKMLLHSGVDLPRPANQFGDFEYACGVTLETSFDGNNESPDKLFFTKVIKVSNKKKKHISEVIHYHADHTAALLGHMDLMTTIINKLLTENE